MLRGKIALVTGATQGIGLAIAHALAFEGCKLILCARNVSRLGRVEAEFSRKKIRLLAVACDIRDRESVAQMFALIGKRFRGLDILVNSAGIAQPLVPTKQLSADVWSDVIATNLTGTFLVTRAALAWMKPGAQIANVLSMSSKRVFPDLAAYNASKFGALGFTNTLREELRKDNIRVIALLPGSTDTPLWETLWPDAPREKMIRPATVAAALVHALKVSPESTIEEVSIMPAGGAL